MKYLESIFAILIVVFCSGTMITSCMESNSRVDNISDTVKSAKEKHEENTVAYEEDFKAFKSDLLYTCELNKNEISKLKNDKIKIAKDSYIEQIEEIETSNENIKHEIETAEVKSNLEWRNLKKELNNKIQQLEDSLNELKS